MATPTTMGKEHIASAKSTNLPISTKHSIELSHYLRYTQTSFAKRFLEEVLEMKQAVPFTRFNRDMGHKPGMAAGRFPLKAAGQFLRLIKAVESNAQQRGLDTANLKITKILANRAAEPFTGGRLRRSTKRTHLEIEVQEKAKKKTDKKEPKKESKKAKEEKK